MSKPGCVVLGAAGQVGMALREQPAPGDLAMTFLDRRDLDITDGERMARVVAEANPAVVVNAAAYTDVDGAETASATAFAVNRDGPAILAQACDKAAACLIHLSSDFVFDGAAGRPYREDDPVSPRGVYARSKAEGEEAVRTRLERHLILRTSWVFGPHRRNFVRAILERAGAGRELRVVDDQIGDPTAAADIACVLLVLAAAAARGECQWGVYHYSGRPAVSRHDLAAEILARARPRMEHIPRLSPVSTADYPSPAPRPAYSSLDCGRISRVFGIEQPDWRPPLARAVERLVDRI